MCTGTGAGSGSTRFRKSSRGCRARSRSTGFRRRFLRRFWRRFQEALVQSQVTFNRVPEKVLENVPEKVGEVLVQSQVSHVQQGSEEGSGEGSGEGRGGFGAEPGQVQQGSGEGSGEGRGGFWCRARSSSTGFRRRFGRRFRRSLRAKPSQVQQKFWQVGGGFGAEPGQGQQGSGEGSGEGSREGLGYDVCSTGFRRMFLEKALVQSQVRFNRVPEKVPEKVGEALVKSQVMFNRVPEKVPEKVGKALVQSQVRFNRILKKVREKVPGGFGAKPGQVQQGTEEFWRRFQKVSGEGPGEGWESFGAEPGQVSTGFWRRFRRRFREALAQSQVRFNRILKKVPEKVSGRLWCRARAGSTGFRRRFRRSGRVWCRARSGSKRVPGEGCREGVGKGFGNLWWRARSGATDSRGFPALGFAARFRKICNNKTLRLFGILPKLIFGFCSEKVSRKPWCKARSNLTRFRKKVSGEGFGDFWCRARSSSTGSWRRFPEQERRLWCKVRFNRKGGFRRKFPRGLGAEPGQLQQGSGEGLRWFKFNRVVEACFWQHALERCLKIKHCGSWDTTQPFLFLIL